MATTRISQASPTEGLSEFTKFPQLPPELRLRVWQHALPTCSDASGRLVIAVKLIWTYTNGKGELLAKVDMNDYEDVTTSDEIYHLGLTSACVESRQEFLKTLKLCLPARLHGRGRHRGTPILRLNDDTIIYFRDFQAFYFKHSSLPEWTDRIKCLAIPIDDLSEVELWCSRNLRYRSILDRLLRWFQAMESFTIVSTYYTGYRMPDFDLDQACKGLRNSLI